MTGKFIKEWEEACKTKSLNLHEISPGVATMLASKDEEDVVSVIYI